MRWLPLVVLLGCGGESCASVFGDHAQDTQVLLWANELGLELRSSLCVEGACTAVLKVSGKILRIECIDKGCVVACGGE